jgi:TolA-binding protein
MKDLFEEEIAAESRTMQDLPINDVTYPPAVEKEERLDREVQEKPDTLPKAKEQEVKKKRGVLYGVAAIVLITLIVVFAFWYKERPVTTPTKEAAVKSVQPAVPDPSVKTAPGKESPTVAKAKEKGPAPDAEAKALSDQAAGMMEKNPGEAKSLLLKAIQLDPASLQGHFQLGSVYMKLKDYPRAIEMFQKVGELDPKYAAAFFNLGYLYAIKKEYPKSEEMYDRVVILAPSYLDEALFNLGMVQEKQGKRKQSIENLERALSVNPNNEMAKKLLEKLKRKS